MAIHCGRELANLTEDMNPNDSEIFYMSWTGVLRGAVITGSEWVLPANFTSVNETENGSVTENGITYSDANSVQVTTTETEGSHTFYNEITASDGRTLRRGFTFAIDNI